MNPLHAKFSRIKSALFAKIWRPIQLLMPARAQNYWHRQGLIKYFFALLLLGFFYRAMSIHELQAGNISLQKKADYQATKFLSELARRGDILDRNGDILASNLLLKKVNLDPTLLQIEYIPALARALNFPEKALSAILEKKRKHGSRYLIIKKNITLTDPMIQNIIQLKRQKIRVCRIKTVKNKPNLLDKGLIFLNIKAAENTTIRKEICKKEKIHGIILQADARRYYPKFAALSPLIGRMNHDKQGAFGIEAEFETTLAGQNGKSRLNLNQQTKHSYFDPVLINTLEHGKNITLTIDANIQFHAYAALKKAVLLREADSGSAIILSPNGEILALANYPADDPNDRRYYNPKHYRNRVLADKVEPGSTMKPFTMLLALDQRKITATDDELIDVTKRIGHVKPDKKYRKLTIKKILQKSHNLGTVNIAERLSKKSMYQTWQKLGFGSPLLLLPSIETSGVLRHYHSWRNSDKRTLSYGYGPMNTSLAQLAKAYLVFANQGAVPSLKLLKDAPDTRKPTRVFSAKSTRKIAHLLDAVVSNRGSGYRAQIKGYNIAGKTGTAELLTNGVYNKKGSKRTFFVGFTPVEKPKYIMAVRLDRPKKCFTSWDPTVRDKCGGSNSAALVFRDAMRNILSNDRSIKFVIKK